MSDSLLINIRFCAHELAKRVPEKDVTREELDKLRESAWALYEEVLKSDLSPNLSRYIFDYLYLIIQAIDDYEITGAVGMERALNSVIGSIFTDTSTAQQVRESPVGGKFWQVITKLGVALKLAKTAVELADGVQKFLLQKP